MTENDDGNLELTYEEMADRLKNAYGAGMAAATALGDSKLPNELPAAMDSALFPDAQRLHSNQPLPPKTGKQTRAERFPDANRLGSGF